MGKRTLAPAPVTPPVVQTPSPTLAPSNSTGVECEQIDVIVMFGGLRVKAWLTRQVVYWQMLMIFILVAFVWALAIKNQHLKRGISGTKWRFSRKRAYPRNDLKARLIVKRKEKEPTTTAG